jgi:uncharacterized membrane protein
LMFTKRRRVNMGAVERRVSLAVGGVLALYALRRSLGHLLLLGLGGYLVYRGTTGNCQIYQALGLSTSSDEEVPFSERMPAWRAARRVPHSLRIEKSVTVNRPPAEVYAYWRKLDNLPQFMDHLESVSSLGGRRSHWVASAPFKAEWDAEVIDECQNELICWRALPGSMVDTAGAVRFRPAPDGFGTQVHVSLQYTPPGGPLGLAAAGLLKGVTAQQVGEDLRRFKEVLEKGETPSVPGQSFGDGGKRLSRRNGSPTKHAAQTASEGSFPVVISGG